jgi:5'-nucleotidase
MLSLMVTNDDGVESPALGPLLRALSRLEGVRVRGVVPDRERSWIGKAITRGEKLHVRPVVDSEVELHAVDGSPADCAQLGIHSILRPKPDLVISGINLGLNYGLSFFYSSGTVGAAMEASFAGVPAIAFSMGKPGDDRGWKAAARGPAWRPRWERAAELCAEIVDGLVRGGFPRECDLISVNFPLEAGPETPRELTRLAPVSYTRLFRPDGTGSFVHDYQGELVEHGAREGTDVGCVAEGRVSITPVRLDPSPALPAVHLTGLVTGRP